MAANYPNNLGERQNSETKEGIFKNKMITIPLIQLLQTARRQANDMLMDSGRELQMRYCEYKWI